MIHSLKDEYIIDHLVFISLLHNLVHKHNLLFLINKIPQRDDRWSIHYYLSRWCFVTVANMIVRRICFESVLFTFSWLLLVNGFRIYFVISIPDVCYNNVIFMKRDKCNASQTADTGEYKTNYIDVSIYFTTWCKQFSEWTEMAFFSSEDCLILWSQVYQCWIEWWLDSSLDVLLCISQSLD